LKGKQTMASIPKWGTDKFNKLPRLAMPDGRTAQIGPWGERFQVWYDGRGSSTYYGTIAEAKKAVELTYGLRQPARPKPTTRLAARKEGWSTKGTSGGEKQHVLQDLRQPPQGWLFREFTVYKRPAHWGVDGGKWAVTHDDGDLYNATLGTYSTLAAAKRRAERERSSTKWHTRRGTYPVRAVPVPGASGSRAAAPRAAKAAKFKWRSIKQGSVIDAYKPWPPAPPYMIFRASGGKWKLALSKSFNDPYNTTDLGRFDTPALAKKAAELHAATGSVGASAKPTKRKPAKRKPTKRKPAKKKVAKRKTVKRKPPRRVTKKQLSSTEQTKRLNAALKGK
jgi:hypothetical protein